MSKVGYGGRGWVRLWRHISRPSWYGCHASPHHTPIVSKRGGVWRHVGRWGRAGSRCGAGVPARPEPAPWARNKYIAPHKIQRGEEQAIDEIRVLKVRVEYMRSASSFKDITRADVELLVNGHSMSGFRLSADLLLGCSYMLYSPSCCLASLSAGWRFARGRLR